MIAGSESEALLIVGKEAMLNSKWTEYAQYCFDREKGLRRDAFTHLNKFLDFADDWTFEEKVEFVRFLFPYCENVTNADYGPLPHPLMERLIKPVLEEWCIKEAGDSTPFRWYGKYCHGGRGYIDKALTINPVDYVAREILTEWSIDGLFYSVHHLPDIYIGDYKEDLLLIKEVEAHIQLLADSQRQEYWTKRLESVAELISNYADWVESGHPNLQEWGEKNKKNVSSGVKIYYYDS